MKYYDCGVTNNIYKNDIEMEYELLTDTGERHIPAAILRVIQQTLSQFTIKSLDRETGFCTLNVIIEDSSDNDDLSESIKTDIKRAAIDFINKNIKIKTIYNVIRSETYEDDELLGSFISNQNATKLFDYYDINNYKEYIDFSIHSCDMKYENNYDLLEGGKVIRLSGFVSGANNEYPNINPYSDFTSCIYKISCGANEITKYWEPDSEPLDTIVFNLPSSNKSMTKDISFEFIFKISAEECVEIGYDGDDDNKEVETALTKKGIGLFIDTLPTSKVKYRKPVNHILDDKPEVLEKEKLSNTGKLIIANLAYIYANKFIDEHEPQQTTPFIQIELKNNQKRKRNDQ